MFPEINTRIVERKAGPLELGQADGLACRTLEMFEAFGFSDEVIREAYLWIAPSNCLAVRVGKK